MTKSNLEILTNIICGDCLLEMRKMQSNSIDFIVTDPPYGLKFMSKKWDYQVPSVNIWKEALRVLKPGGMAAIFGGSRTYHRMTVNVEDAGFEIRDCIMWIQGQGFPKSHNFGRQLSKEWEGYGTALKPAYEPILIAMKPLEGTFIQNAEKWGVAGINIEESRISTIPRTTHSDGNYKGKNPGIFQLGLKEGYQNEGSTGRWPANIILDEEAGKMLDEQSGILKTGSMKPQLHEKKNSIYSKWKQASPGQKGSIGGASRFFYCAKASSKERNAGLEGMLLKSSGIKNASGRGFSESDPYKEIKRQNNHPTVKPISLMEYIIKLLAPPGNPILLDPFCGSGSTCLAAANLGINSIGIDISDEYCDIARKRCTNNDEN